MAKALRITAVVCAVVACLVVSGAVYGVTRMGDTILADVDPCTDSVDAVIRAASRGDRDRVVERLRAGEDIDQQVDDRTALACASAAGEVAMVDLLLAEGATPGPEALQAAVGAST